MPSLTTPTPSQLSTAQRAAWEAMVHAHGQLITTVEQALSEADLPPVDWYNVLAPILASADGALRPRDLGCGVQISRSGLTRLLDRMEAAGVVERRRCDVDRRGSYVAITDEGKETAERMRTVIENRLAESFGRQVDDHAAEQLTDLLGLVSTAG